VTRFARAVFVLLVAASFSAFFVAQKLKASPPVLEVSKVTKFFSPNGDGRRDANKISLRLKERDDVTVDVVDTDGGAVRRLATAIPARPFQPVRLTWDGRTDAGTLAPDGQYRLRIGLRRQGRSVTVPRVIDLDTTAPTPTVVSAQPDVLGPTPGPVQVRVRGISRRLPTEFRVLRTDVNPPREIARFQSERAGSRRATWNGMTADNRPPPPGTYLIVAQVKDRADNIGTAPAKLPAQPGEIRGQPGVTVRHLVAQPPVEPVRAGKRVEFFVDSRGLTYRWRVRRIGASRPVKKGSAKPGEPLVMRAPRGISGVYLLELRHGRFATQVPFLVQSEARARLLVVVPTITWLGLDKVDDRPRDGLPNTLDDGGPVGWPRVFAGPDQASGLPARFAEDVAPLLVYLDRSHIRYDLASDLALSQSDDPRATDRDGVLLAGTFRWIPRTLARRLRRYVQDGGRLASFGIQSLRRGVSVGTNRLARPTGATSLDPFGARLAPVRRVSGPPDSPQPPVIALTGPQALGLLTNTDGALQGFREFEESQQDEGGRLLVTLGQDISEEERAQAEAKGEEPREPRPALTARRLGKGVVVRIGLPEWAGRIREDPEIAQITHNIVDILRGVSPRPRSSG
jgi:hypothetical protein